MSWWWPFGRKSVPEQLKDKIIYFLSEAKSCVNVTLNYLNRGKFKKAHKYAENAREFLRHCELEVARGKLNEKLPILNNTIRYGKELPTDLWTIINRVNPPRGEEKRKEVESSRKKFDQLLSFIDKSENEVNQNL
ncbi:hypothetical protein HYX03_00780 [Candidatus Woesearchaeota archaeon]|nr:hypothetical protein [Candidatus Woesearchaeota archaeon]